MDEIRGEKLAVVVPTLNEAGNIPVLLDRLQSALSTANIINYELIVVDDDSSDGTADAARRYGSQDPRIRVFVRKGQRGLAGAVIHGWKNTDATLLGVIDADLQHPPEVMPQLVEAVCAGSDIAVASRYSTGEDLVGNWNVVRKMISRWGTWATVPLQRRGARVKDPLSGFFVVRRSAIDGVDLQPQGFKILLEILVKAKIKKATEVPFHFATRHSGKSKADVRIALQYFSLLGKLSRHAIFKAGQ